MNNNILFFLEEIKEHLNPQEKSKKIAYSKIINIIKNLDFKIDCNTELSKIKGIGKKTDEKIRIFLNGDSDNSTHQLYSEMLEITGIGNKKAKELCNQVETMDELIENKDKLLNNKQKLGLKYYKYDRLKIPRCEMDEHYKYIQKQIDGNINNSQYTITGSYRRNKDVSGDIDLIITCESNILNKLVETFINSNYIIDTYAKGVNKFMGWCKLPIEWCKLPNNTPRRLDILFSSQEEYPFSILYFTGSREYNKFMRTEAIKQNLRLNEHGLFDKGTMESVDHYFNDEKSIFDYLNIDYIEPHCRY